MVTDHFRQLWLLALAAVPGMVLLVAIIITTIPKHIDGLAGFMPALYVPVIYYWGMHHARHMPYWLVFLAGLVVDALGGQPMGLTSLLMIGFLIAVHYQHRTMHKEGFVLQWAMFALMLLVVSVSQWLIMMFYQQAYITPVGGILQWMITTCLYPMMHQIFEGINRLLQNRRYQLLHGR
jgi:rod shape-determining protein MreD